MPRKGKQGGARPPATGRAKRVGVPKITTAELNRRRQIQEFQSEIAVAKLSRIQMQKNTASLYRLLLCHFPKKDWSLEEE